MTGKMTRWGSFVEKISSSYSDSVRYGRLGEIIEAIGYTVTGLLKISALILVIAAAVGLLILPTFLADHFKNSHWYWGYSWLVLFVGYLVGKESE